MSNRTNEQMNFVLYDNACNMCKASVQFLKKRDKKNRIQFMPLESIEARQELKKVGVMFMQKNTVYFIYQHKAFTKSTAVLKALSVLPFPYSALSMFLVVPRFIRDAVYNFIAKNRHRL